MAMQFHDRSRLTKFYNNSLSAYGENDPRGVHWQNSDNQQKRFQILSQIGDLNGKSVLDVGCGFGDLYGFLVREGKSTEYSGIDIVSEFISAARRKYPNANFEEKDIFDIEKQYDYVLASGALSFKVENHHQYYEEMIRKMFEIAKIGIAFNMLDIKNHIDDAEFASYDSNEIASFCKTLTPKVEVITDYLPQDFTIYMYK